MSTAAEIIAECARRPGQVVTVTMPDISAPLLIRRHVRAALNSARIRGAEVEVLEERGLLDSVFSVRMRGTDRQVVPALRALAALEE